MTTELNTPVFVVGLERLKAERYQRVLNDLARIGVAATVWPAVDGTLPIKYEPGESVARFQFYNYAFWHRALFKTEIACYLSHYRLWKHAFEKQNHERIVVFEDDVIFDATHFKEALTNIAKLDQAFEYIKLEQERRGAVKGPPLAKGGEHALYELDTYFIVGAYGYSLSRQGFKKLAPTLMPISKPVDIAIMYSRNKVNLSFWAVQPPLCRVDRSVASSARPSKHWTGRWRRRQLIKFALAPARWIYLARELTDWMSLRQDAPPSRRAYASAYAKALFTRAWRDVNRRPFKRTSTRVWALVRGFLRGGVSRL